MTMNRPVSLLALVAVAAFAGACSSERQTTVLTPTTPSATSSTSTRAAKSLLGTWTSAAGLHSANATLPSSLSQCSNLQLNVTDQTATNATGTLTMTCVGGGTINGTITGQLGGPTIPVVYQGAVTGDNLYCDFRMQGTLTPLTSD